MGELPLVLVGLVDGTLALAEVLKASFNLAPEIQVTDMGRRIKGREVELVNEFVPLTGKLPSFLMCSWLLQSTR